MDTTTTQTAREQVLRDYTVNEAGTITSPGKFEGEMLYAPHYWGLALDGMVDEDDGTVFRFALNETDGALWPELDGNYDLELRVDDSGFVHASVDTLLNELMDTPMNNEQPTQPLGSPAPAIAQRLGKRHEDREEGREEGCERGLPHEPLWNGILPEYAGSEAIERLSARVARMESALRQLAQCNLNDSNCAGWEVANARLRRLARWGLSLEEQPKR